MYFACLPTNSQLLYSILELESISLSTDLCSVSGIVSTVLCVIISSMYAYNVHVVHVQLLLNDTCTLYLMLAFLYNLNTCTSLADPE